MRLIDADLLDDEVIHWSVYITGNPKQHTVVNECKSSFRNMIENQPTVELPVWGGWIPCSEKLPENETEVEITCIRRYIGAGNEEKVSLFTTRAFYTDGTMTTEDSNFTWCDTEDNWEYDEEKDAYIIPKGWWEYVTFSEEFGAVDAEVIAWRPLPKPYDMGKKVQDE